MVPLTTIRPAVLVRVILLTALITLLRELHLPLTVTQQVGIILRLLTHMVRLVIMVRLPLITPLIRHQALYPVQDLRLSLRVSVHQAFIG